MWPEDSLPVVAELLHAHNRILHSSLPIEERRQGSPIPSQASLLPHEVEGECRLMPDRMCSYFTGFLKKFLHYLEELCTDCPMDSVLVLDSYWPGAMKDASFQKGASYNLEKQFPKMSHWENALKLGKIL